MTAAVAALLSHETEKRDVGGEENDADDVDAHLALIDEAEAGHSHFLVAVAHPSLPSAQQLRVLIIVVRVRFFALCCGCGSTVSTAALAA